MMSLEQAIEHAEEVAIEQEHLMARYDAASGYARSGNESIRTESAKECEKCAEEHRQLAAWLRELAERRKAPEIIFCKDCTRRRKNTETGEYYCRASGLRNTDYDFCSGGKRPGRRTDGERAGD